MGEPCLLLQQVISCLTEMLYLMRSKEDDFRWTTDISDAVETGTSSWTTDNGFCDKRVLSRVCFRLEINLRT